MKLGNVIMIGVGVVALSTVGLMAEDVLTAPAAKEPGAAKAEQEFTLTGTLTKVERANAAGVKEVSFVLTQAGEVVARLAPKAADAAGINLETFAKAKVNLVGTGHEMQLHGKKTIFISQVTKIEKAEDKAGGAVEEKPAAKPAE